MDYHPIKKPNVKNMKVKPNLIKHTGEKGMPFGMVFSRSCPGCRAAPLQYGP